MSQNVSLGNMFYEKEGLNYFCIVIFFSKTRPSRSAASIKCNKSFRKGNPSKQKPTILNLSWSEKMITSTVTVTVLSISVNCPVEKPVNFEIITRTPPNIVSHWAVAFRITIAVNAFRSFKTYQDFHSYLIANHGHIFQKFTIAAFLDLKSTLDLIGHLVLWNCITFKNESGKFVSVF